MTEDKKIVDLIGDQELKASETIEVTLEALISKCIFSLLFSMHFLWNYTVVRRICLNIRTSCPW